MSKAVTEHFSDEEAMLNWCDQAAKKLTSGVVIHLQGDLGMGKTTWSRGFIQGLGHQGRVKSPTYTLVEPYDLSARKVYHFDLYRLADPEELEFMGVRDYFTDETVCLIEWPEKGEGVLPQADIEVHLTQWHEGRCMNCVALTAKGEQQLGAWS